jgi:hypothetical protein
MRKCEDKIKNKEKIIQRIVFTLIVIITVVIGFVAPQIFLRTTDSQKKDIHYDEREMLKEMFEQEVEQLKEKTFENSQLSQEMEKKNPLPLELRRERFVVFSETMKLHKKYLTVEEYGAFCLLYRDMQERKLDTGEVKLMMYLMLKVTDNATPEEKKIYEEGHELDRKITAYFAQEESPAKDKK